VTRESAVYEGRLAHLRHGPRRHAFSLPVWLLYLDLDELPELLAGPGPLRAGRAGLLSFHRPDYLAGAADLARAARERVAALLGFEPRGPVRLLTHVRALGYVFNPVSFYYCFAPDGRTLEAVLAEITNTPWGERHCYAVPAGPRGVAAQLDKAFHVSPFFPMEQRYAWSLTVPGETLRVDMANLEAGREVFRARLALARRPWTARALWRAALLRPAMAAVVHAAIYLHAFALWAKGTPFHPHPPPQAAPLAARRS
jgi:DUF1365 family protein